MTKEEKTLTLRDLKTKIHIIRDQNVMLDYDLAEIYGYEVKRLNEQVKRNIDRFPEDFLFKLNSQEMDELSKSQIATSIQRPGIRGGRTHNIYAFTEQGIYMLATVLKGELAIQQSIYIMRTFKNMKDYLQENRVLITSEERKMIHHHEKDISSLKDTIKKLNDSFLNNDIKGITILNNEKYKADDLFIKLIKKAKQNIILVDDYPGIRVLNFLSAKKRTTNVSIITKNRKRANERLTKMLIDDFNVTNPSITLKYNQNIHDRYLFLDYETENEELYHLRASMNDVGTNISSIIKMDDTEVIKLQITKALKQEDLLLNGE